VKRIAILGSTGSIGRNALSVVAAHPGQLEVVGLAAGRNVGLFSEQVRRFQPRVVSMASTIAIDEVRQALSDGTGNLPVCVTAGAEGLEEVATHPDVDVVICATSGTVALQAVLAAIVAGKTIALANKEVLVMAGALMMDAAKTHGATILPVDSEHSAIHQCLQGRVSADVARLILTASGGPFRHWPAERLRNVTPKDALDHPTWDMGPKITVDSSTLMNKGLEVIEARWLFDMGPDRIDVVVHPQSVVHSLVELLDGSVIAQLGVTDMRLPIQYALSYPARWPTELPPLDLTACGRLEFSQPDTNRFPCLRLAYRALEGGSAFPVVLNAANEVAVEAFLAGYLSYSGIAALIEQLLDAAEHEGWSEIESLAAVREADAWTRRFSRELVGKVKSEGS
jgi:1-deoxy-D-xylulose-5-phosphate reductoisomerase